MNPSEEVAVPPEATVTLAGLKFVCIPDGGEAENEIVVAIALLTAIVVIPHRKLLGVPVISVDVGLADTVKSQGSVKGIVKVCPNPLAWAVTLTV